MKNLMTVFMLGASLTLVSCGGASTDDAATNKKASKTSSQKTGFLVDITGTEASGKDCIVSIKLSNKTGQEVSLFQFIKYTAIYDGGKYTDHGSNYSLENGESTTRAGVIVVGMSCKEVREIRIDEMLCNYQRDPVSMMSPSCADEVVFRGNKQVKLTLP